MRAWINGRLLDSPQEMAVTVLDHGMIVGDGVFETIKIENGGPFALTRHLDRLTRSATGLGLASPDHETLREGVTATMAGPDIEFGRIRITFTSGMGPLGSPRGKTTPTMVVITKPCVKGSRPPWPVRTSSSAGSGSRLPRVWARWARLAARRPRRWW